MGVETIDKDIIRYSQCWEDADTLIEHMQVKEGETVLSIASAGDNTLSLLAQGPKKVIAVDLSVAQLALLELKAQCFKSLSHAELLYFLGAKESNLSGVASETGVQSNSHVASETEVQSDSRVDSETQVQSDSRVASETRVQSDSRVVSETRVQSDSRVDSETPVQSDSRVDSDAGLTRRDRPAIYRSMRKHLSSRARSFFDQRPGQVEGGVISQGKLERYFIVFRRFVLPLVKSKAMIAQLLKPKARESRASFYRQKWGTPAYNILFRLFFSSFFMALLGREKCFFTYAREGLSQGLLQSSKTALIEQEPADNPYLYWILTGDYGPGLPHYLRQENFEAIRANISALELRQGNLNDVVRELPEGSIQSFNLSDVFEYLSADQSATLAKLIIRAGARGARMVYWNMLVERTTAAYCPDQLKIEEDYNTSLAAITKTFFYKRLLVERVCK